MTNVWANARLIDAIRERAVGETVNVHVVDFAKEPSPDFEQMQRTISGEETPQSKDSYQGEPERGR